MPIQIQIRRDTAANWTAANPVLAAGEWGLETDTGKLKLGDGTTAWTSLAYRLVGGTPALTLGTANAAGSASTAIATDATIAAFDGTAPASSAPGDAAATGVAAVAARRDHKHAREAWGGAVDIGAETFGAAAAAGATGKVADAGHVHAMPANPAPGFATPSIALGSAAAAGAASTVIRSDATIAAFDGTTPAAETFGAAGATGSAAFAARRDHVHAMPADPTGKPLGLTGATAATRYVGATTSGAPISGTFAVGDYIIDQSGKVWICTTAGTPGTWTQVSGGLTNPMTTTGDIIIGNPGSTPARLAVGGANTVLHGGTTPAYSAVVEGDLSLSDVTTANATTTAHGLLPKLGGGTTNFLRADGTWAAPPAGSLTTASSVLGADVNLTASTWTNIVSVSLAAGTWLIWAPCRLYNATNSAIWDARIWDGTTTYGSQSVETNSTNGRHASLVPVAIVTPASTTTYYLAVYTTQGSGQVKYLSSATGVSNATQIIAVKVA